MIRSVNPEEGNFAYMNIGGYCCSEVSKRDIVKGTFVKANEKGVLVNIPNGLTTGLIIGSRFLDKGGNTYDILASDIEKTYQPGDTFITNLSRIYPKSNEMIGVSKLLPTLMSEYYLAKKEDTRSIILEEIEPKIDSRIRRFFKRIIGR